MNDYSPKEERLNVLSHALGFFLSIVALFFLIFRAAEMGNSWHITSVTIFGVSMIILYAASTLYHNSKEIEKRRKLKIFDHAAIFVLIAGTYTPFTLITLEGTVGWTIFAVIWGMAITGVTLKLFFTGKYKILSTIMYVLMGWVIIFAIKPLIESLSSGGLFWLFLGGVFYTVGAILYSIKKIKFNHAIFHFCVLAGTFCHFYSVYHFVLPS
ncbi:PAQR family membrane homeostasis protein TrhA [Brumimicrobium oceani]|uniref:Hemolysin D n=1 Tax=Brumimicrobium oceani TaxID=2100725 RepID=A0A2U2XHJ1_9FLAO|nr:hemolysin III family protein [Brumimicrobium oceani]PWH87210.1 hemolysin D [Brumimicrobium oceani]